MCIIGCSLVVSVSSRNNVRVEMHSSVETRANMFRQRYLQIQQRLLRSGKFVLRGMSSSAKPGLQNVAKADRKIEISSIESLLGSTSSTNRLLLAYITQPEEEGQWYLEDLSTSIIKVDLSRLFNDSGTGNSGGTGCGNINKLFMEGNIVLVEGSVVRSRRVFEAQSLCYPAAEERSTTMRALGQNGMYSLWCGADQAVNSGMNRPQYWEEMEGLELRDEGQMIVSLADIELDKPHVTEKLQQLFATFESSFEDSASSDGVRDLNQAPVFILVGPFIVQTDILSYQGRELALRCWDEFARLLINCCPVLLAVAKFVFVPSSKDVYCTGGNSAAMPHFPISDLFTDSFRRQLAVHITHTREMLGLDPAPDAENIVFTSNPSRVHYYSQELVIFQEDFLRRMQKHAHFFPPAAGAAAPGDQDLDASMNMSVDDPDAGDGGDSRLAGSARLILQCILDQGHLSPLSLTHNLSPLIWSLDHAMSLSPLPHLVSSLCMLRIHDLCSHFFLLLPLFFFS